MAAPHPFPISAPFRAAKALDYAKVDDHRPRTILDWCIQSDPLDDTLPAPGHHAIEIAAGNLGRTRPALRQLLSLRRTPAATHTESPAPPQLRQGEPLRDLVAPNPWAPSAPLRYRHSSQYRGWRQGHLRGQRPRRPIDSPYSDQSVLVDCEAGRSGPAFELNRRNRDQELSQCAPSTRAAAESGWVGSTSDPTVMPAQPNNSVPGHANRDSR